MGLGTHILQIISPDFYFDRVRLDITSLQPPVTKASLTLPGTTFKQIGPLLRPSDLEIQARANGGGGGGVRNDFFMKREGFNVWGILSNPMLLMMAFSMGMMFLLPKLTAGMNEEELKELQSKQINPQNMEMPDVSQWMANWMAGDAKPPSASGSSGSGVKRK